ncbi:MAG: rhomboid family intramembrane serine protease [Candidatus Brocadiia bacterium]
MFGRRARASRRQCPKCDQPMNSVSIKGAEIDLCPGCSGMWFDPGELSRAVGFKFKESADGRALAGADRTEHRCPACAVPLYERDLGDHAGVRIDQCPQCSGIFLDRGELTRVQQHFRRAGAPAMESRPSTPEAEGPTYVDANGGLLAALHYLSGLPLEVDVPQTLFPPTVMALIIVNIAVLILAYTHGFADWVREFGMVPAEVLRGRRLHTLLTHMFMHGGVVHLVGNMYFLYISGDNIEERFGWHRFLGFFVLCGVVGALAHAVGAGDPQVPAVGASGAISGLLGAYVVFWPRTRFLIRTFWRIGFWIRPIEYEIPAWAYLGFWILVQVTYVGMDVPGVAWWAHIGGFLTGATVAVICRLHGPNRAPAA